jgi:hypothetical protein
MQRRGSDRQGWIGRGDASQQRHRQDDGIRVGLGGICFVLGSGRKCIRELSGLPAGVALAAAQQPPGWTTTRKLSSHRVLKLKARYRLWHWVRSGKKWSFDVAREVMIELGSFWQKARRIFLAELPLVFSKLFEACRRLVRE